ncbi:MAG: high-potential iron-sulfur protein [Xanthobacteraceae bacterium]
MSATEFSRRLVLRHVATAAGTVATLGFRVSRGTAQVKLAKKDVDYQEQPKGNQRCENCFNFEAPSGCKVVDGQVIPQGWCKAYAPKPS